MKKVIIESPYAGNIKQNIKYARACLKDSLNRNEAPLASHLLYTQDGVLDDTVQAERMQGINAGLAWKEFADLHVFYVDYGMSNGMKYALNYLTNKNTKTVFRKLYNSRRTIAEEQ